MDVLNVILWLFIIVSVIVIGGVAISVIGLGASIVNKVAEGIDNGASPIEDFQAMVVSKRTHIWGEHSQTDYYLTFESANGERREFEVKGPEYGMLIEGDEGVLKVQGKRYLGFTRSTRASGAVK